MNDDGCARCSSADAGDVWTAGHHAVVRQLFQESHVGVRIDACACGRRFVHVFTERIDWVGGNDDQTWILAPLSSDEAARLAACDDEGAVSSALRALPPRRFVVRSWGTSGAVECWWRDGVVSIGPHD